MRDRSAPRTARTKERYEALYALYLNKQQWMRHYEALVAQITPVSATASIGLCAYIAENHATIRYPELILMIPAVTIGFASWFTWWSDCEIRNGFSQIASTETGMGFYDLEVDGEFVLPIRYKQGARHMRPIVAAGYLAQVVSGLVLLAVVAFLLSQGG